MQRLANRDQVRFIYHLALITLMEKRHAFARHWVVETLQTELRERPVRLALFAMFVLVVSCLVPYAERRGPDGTVVRQWTNTVEGAISTDRASTCLGNSSTDEARNAWGGHCTMTEDRISTPWGIPRALTSHRAKPNVPT